MEERLMDPGVAAFVETALRVALGLRFLSSGVSNIRRWPHATETAQVLFPAGNYFFCAVAVALMVLGCAGLAFGFQIEISAFMVFIFMLTTVSLLTDI